MLISCKKSTNLQQVRILCRGMASKKTVRFHQNWTGLYLKLLFTYNFEQSLTPLPEKTFLYNKEGNRAKSTLPMKSEISLHRTRDFPVGVHFIGVCPLAT